MAPDDRDRTFEKSLARHLRSGASPPDCLDAELLAAYHERLLAPDQMISCKQHVASCARCQEILAQLEATDDLLVETETDQQQHSPANVLTMPAPHETPELVPALSEQTSTDQVAVPSRAARLAQSPWRSKTLHGANWRWLAPAGLFAAGLLIWIAFHETTPSEFKLAKNTSPAAPPPAAQSPAAKSSLPLSPAGAPPSSGALNKEKEEEVARTEPSGNSADARSSREDASSYPRQIPQTAESKQNERSKSSSSVMLDEKKSPSRVSGQLASPHAISPALSVGGERDVDRPNLTASVTSQDNASTAQDQLSRVQSAPPPAPAAPANQKDDSPIAVAENAPAPQSQQALKAKSIAGGRETPQQAKAEIAGATQLRTVQSESAPAMRVAKSQTGAYATVVAPDSTSMWRFASAGLVEHSSDSGSTWAIQPTGVVADLLAASAPSAKICWIAGRDATILRTTDAGAHWTKLAAPTAADITDIFAVNATQATVTTSAHETYATKDAAKTWSRVPNP